MGLSEQEYRGRPAANRNKNELISELLELYKFSMSSVLLLTSLVLLRSSCFSFLSPSPGINRPSITSTIHLKSPGPKVIWYLTKVLNRSNEKHSYRPHEPQTVVLAS